MLDDPISAGANQQVHRASLKRKLKKRQRSEISCARNIGTWPILSSVDLSLTFNNSHGPFIDSDMKLVKLELEKFEGWKRAGMLFRQPVIIRTLDWKNVKQSKVEDCSVVAALVVCANYEQSNITKEPLISRSIYPQDEYGRPVINPCGKYGVKLHFNGAERLVVIDDFLPISNENFPLCSRTLRGDELWVSLLEKAYLKLACPYGYDISGSKGDYDLHTFTGWIPDRIRLKSCGNFQAVPNKMEVFDDLHDRMLSGDVLAIASTHKRSDEYEGTMVGLRSGHAYAVLETRMFEDKRFVKLKNPWAREAWRGRFSARDLPSWTPTMRMALNFTPEDALMCDDGIFWIEFEDLCEFFGTLYLSWNPDVFPYRFQMLQFLSPCSGKERKDGDISSFPQVVLEVGGGCTSTDRAEVWILAMRHVTEGLSPMKTREYVALAVYDSNGKRVEKSDDSRVIYDGFDSRRDPSHYFLAKCCLPTGKYTVVILHRTNQCICCTMTTYSSVLVTLAKVTEISSRSEG